MKFLREVDEGCTAMVEVEGREYLLDYEYGDCDDDNEEGLVEMTDGGLVCNRACKDGMWFYGGIGPGPTREQQEQALELLYAFVIGHYE